MANLTSEIITSLKKDNGDDLHSVTLTDGSEVVIKPLGRKKNSEIQKFIQEKKKAIKPNSPLDVLEAEEEIINNDVETMVLNECVVFPLADELASFLESRAGIGPSLVESIYGLSGFFIPGPPTKL